MKPPDRKGRELVQYYRDRVAADVFNERDVAALLIGLRTEYADNPVVFELGSFLAHRRRTKGHFHRFFASGIRASQSEAGLRLGMDAEPLYSETDIANSINKALQRLSIDPIGSEVVSALVLCLISLLQDVTFEDRDDSRELGRLFLAFSHEEVFAIAAIRVGETTEQIVPALRTHNKWFPWQAEPTGGRDQAFLVVPNHWVTIERTPSGLAAMPH
jgi:hypothetical protein